jgi:alginate O-acetyltransferase complex protein AlgI
MIFASLVFVFLILPLFLVTDFSARMAGSGVLRNAGLLAVSLLFYLWGEAANVLLLLFLGVFNHAAGCYLTKSSRPRLALALFVAVNLSVLIGYKYFYWLASFFPLPLVTRKISMPLGISFFTFHAISYLVDVHRGHIAPARTALDFLAYFCMFPHLVAGPIVRYAQIKDDLAVRGPDKALFSFGMYRFLVGFNKKVIIANQVAIMADSAFSMSGLGNLHCLDAWLGILAYTVQIYFDFSGYSDMAIGLAAMAGFRFEENFRRPYSSISIRDFWRRWHISLSSWLRDYLYVPLGGSKGGTIATYRNLLLVFLLCGLWHGADVTFVVWGLWHGLFLVFERLPFGRRIERLPVIFRRSYVLFVVVVGWVFFRAENIDAALVYLGNMFAFTSAPMVLTYHKAALLALAGGGGGLCLISDKCLSCPSSHRPGVFSAASYCVQAILGVVSVSFILTGARNPFIYFDF